MSLIDLISSPIGDKCAVFTIPKRYWCPYLVLRVTNGERLVPFTPFLLDELTKNCQTPQALFACTGKGPGPPLPSLNPLPTPHSLFELEDMEKPDEVATKLQVEDLPEACAAMLTSLEANAKLLSGNVAHLLGSLGQSGRAICGITLSYVQVHQDSSAEFEKVANTAVANAAQLIARVEELNKEMSPVLEMATEMWVKRGKVEYNLYRRGLKEDVKRLEQAYARLLKERR